MIDECPYREHDGRLTLSNVIDMLELGREQSRLHQPYEFAAQLSGFCTLQMWQALSQQGGVDRFAEWCADVCVVSSGANHLVWWHVVEQPLGGM